eukprot:s7949_g1.t2
MSRDLEPELKEPAAVEAGTAFLEGESADYTHCDGLPCTGSHVIDMARIFSASCTWHGHPGLQVTLKKTLTFQGNLVLTGEIQIIGEPVLEGPCINVIGKMTVIAANASFVGCRNKMQTGRGIGQDERGGALVIQQNVIVSKSSVKFENCSASEGGGLYAAGGFSQEAESTVTFENCTASGSGGGAAVNGNAKAVNGNFKQAPNSSAIFRSCSAGYGAWAAFLRRPLHWGQLLPRSRKQGDLRELHGLRSFGNGGGAQVQKDFVQGPNSSAIFRSCSASVDGGGLHASRYEQEVGSSVLFQHCSAGRDGGGVITEKLDGNGSMCFEACRARAGGGLSITTGGTARHGGSLAFEVCNAGSIGGGLYIDAGQGQFRKLLLDRCDADVAAAAFAAIAANGTEAEVLIEELSLSRASESIVNDVAVSGLLKLGYAHLSTESSSGIYISAHNLSLEDVMNCTSTSTCTFNANAATRAAFLCPLGAGSVDFEELHDFGCLACRPGDTQVLNMTSRPCSQCPEGASKCLASELKMEPGRMVELEDVNRSFHCPNEAACPGGDVSQGRVHLAMCADGYFGRGCTSCSDEHAMADSSVFSCTACSKDRRVQAGQILAAVLQTQTAKDIKSDAAHFLFNAAAYTAESASGQGHALQSAGPGLTQGSLRSASSQCLLSYVGYEKTLWGTHLLDVVVAAGLISSLALMKDFRVALIAGPSV